LENNDILKTIWKFKKKGSVYNNVHLLCGNIADAIIKYSLIKLSGDNVTCIFIAFQNFKNEMEKNEFEYEDKIIECKYIEDEIDLSNSD